ncbi:MAG: PAS domain S-box protein, partial [Gemmatimonadota bacterium]|nr:PAS domain S-box protein [Gemmatimonadota bacterium]
TASRCLRASSSARKRPASPCSTTAEAPAQYGRPHNLFCGLMNGTYDRLLVTLSVVVAIFASYTALDLTGRVTAARGRVRFAWLVGGSLSMGIGIWSMHFIGMLAFQIRGMPIAYDVPLWLLSVAIAITTSFLALLVVSRPSMDVGALLTAGLVMGAAIAGMHYTGMAAMRVPGRIGYDPRLVTLSVAIAVAASCVALWLASRLRTDETRSGRWSKVAGGIVMGSAISGMHYTGMAAVRVTPSAVPLEVHENHLLATDGLALSVVVGTLALLILAVVSAVVDRRLRARLEAAEAVRQSENRFRALVAATTQIVWVTDPEGLLLPNQAEWGAFTGQSAEEYQGQGWIEAIHPDDQGRTAEAWSTAVDTGTLYQVEHRVRRHNGQYRTFSVRAVPVLEADGGVREWVGTHTDITEERAREEQNRLLAAAVDSLSEGVCVVDVAGHVRYANAAYCEILGCTPAELAGMTTLSFLPDESTPEERSEIIMRVREEGGWTGRVQRRRLNGEVVPLEMIVGRVEHAKRELFFMICRDITKDLAREQQLRRAERLASVGTLIGGVAHELNNPLHAILSFAELLLMEERNSDDREGLEIIKREADRAAKVVSDLGLLARDTQGEAGERAAVDLNDIVRHVLKVRRYGLTTGNVEIQEDLAGDLPPVLAERSAIEQVVLNLVANAEQAMAGQKELRRLVLRTRRTPAGASVHVIDSGPGIPPHHLERIFDPFFTTKSPGEGTGLGLSLAHSIVTEHGGGKEFLARLRARGQGLDRRLIFFTGDVASGQSVRVLAEANVPVLAKPVQLEDLARAHPREFARGSTTGS